MQVRLTQKPKGATLIEGFPGFGLIGTITTEFLIDQLGAECIGTILAPELPAMATLHEEKLVHPMGIFYDKKNNLIILHIIMPIHGIEWRLASAIGQLAKDLSLKDILSIEGVNSPAVREEPKIFSYTENPAMEKRFAKAQLPRLKEGIILGLTGALMLSEMPAPYSCLFIETHSALPDSKAAAKIISILNELFNLNMDTKPLVEQATRFEEKLRSIIERGKEAATEQEKKKLSYVG